MQIETYEIEDATSEASAMANDAEAIALIERLGLEGQKKQSNSITLTRCPYREMTKEEFLVYKTLFTRSCPVESFQSGTIPLRVLQVIAHAKDCNLFRRLEVWYPESARVDDPVLTGFIGPNDYTGEWYILARWGKALLPFETLKGEAIKVLRSERLDKIRETIEKCNMLLKTVPAMTTLQALSRREYLSDV